MKAFLLASLLLLSPAMVRAEEAVCPPDQSTQAELRAMLSSIQLDVNNQVFSYVGKDAESLAELMPTLGGPTLDYKPINAYIIYNEAKPKGVAVYSQPNGCVKDVIIAPIAPLQRATLLMMKTKA